MNKKSTQQKHKQTRNSVPRKGIADGRLEAFWGYLIIALLIGIVLYGFITQILHHLWSDSKQDK